MDLGTANTIIYFQDKVVVDEPSIVAKDRMTGNVVAIGRLAQQMHGKTHKNIETCLLYTSPSPRDRQKSRMPSSA